MLGIVMKHSNTTPQTLPQQPPQQQEMLARFDASPNNYFSRIAYSHTLPPQVVQGRNSKDSHILDMETK